MTGPSDVPVTTEARPPAAHGLLRGIACALGIGLLALLAAARPDARSALGPIELETRSDYSHIRIRRLGNYRTLSFVRDSGQEVLESQIDVEKPHDLTVPYTRFMFLSYAFQPQPKRVLIVGLGGGAMVHFLRHYDPQVQVDVVEIDPAIVKLAESHFGVRSEGRVNIITQDAFDLFARTEAKYDVIYMDAFLKPAADTDSTGVPLRLKTEAFYREVQSRLTTEGIMVFNLNAHVQQRDDLATLGRVFPQLYAFRMPESGGVVAVGTLAGGRLSYAQLQSETASLNRRFRTSWSFTELARHLQR